MGYRINPEFVSAANNLLRRQQEYDSARDSGDEQAMRLAEVAFHKAEGVYCNLPGMISGEETEEAVQGQIDALMGKVSLWYNK